MKIGIIGASGKVGRLVLKEAIERSHEVTAIVRDQTKLETSNVAVIEKNILDLTQNDVKQFDVIVNAFGAPLGEEQAHVDAVHEKFDAEGNLTDESTIAFIDSVIANFQEWMKLYV